MDLNPTPPACQASAVPLDYGLSFGLLRVKHLKTCHNCDIFLYLVSNKEKERKKINKSRIEKKKKKKKEKKKERKRERKIR